MVLSEVVPQEFQRAELQLGSQHDNVYKQHERYRDYSRENECRSVPHGLIVGERVASAVKANAVVLENGVTEDISDDGSHERHYYREYHVVAYQLALCVAGGAQRADNSGFGGYGVGDSHGENERDKRDHHIAHHHRAGFVTADIIYRECHSLVEISRNVVIHRDDVRFVDLVFEFLVSGHLEISSVEFSVCSVLDDTPEEVVQFNGKVLSAGLFHLADVVVDKFLLGRSISFRAGEGGFYSAFNKGKGVIVDIH